VVAEHWSAVFGVIGDQTSSGTGSMAGVGAAHPGNHRQFVSAYSVTNRKTLHRSFKIGIGSPTTYQDATEAVIRWSSRHVAR
jgi:hypothetical protein